MRDVEQAAVETIPFEQEATQARDQSQLATSTEASSECVLIEEFDGSSSLVWRAVNDGVMGGLSDGVVVVGDGILTHSGTLVTRGGGFSYAGTRVPNDLLDDYQRLQVRLNTYGRQYAVNFDDARYRSISHRAVIPLNQSREWQEVFVDFDDTIPTFFGSRADSEPFDARFVDEINFILSDGVDGPFQMDVDWIKACK